MTDYCTDYACDLPRNKYTRLRFFQPLCCKQKYREHFINCTNKNKISIFFFFNLKVIFFFRIILLKSATGTWYEIWDLKLE
ncbi:hypothetical protein GDO81_003275 [Engystomops pustulosus]|uniref:Uncharacterized protein n=1 Tax=Engystomops pustulosus TaxID=76066 RepID=A0AAV6ZYR8_ENGPU|nr:hypothetical protein GDO81_003275 [Engystomops pustulosus]